MKYLYEPTAHFSGRLERIRLRDPAGHSRIRAVIDRILSNPEDTDGRMHGPYHGTFKKYVGRREYRLVYYWCELCRKANRRLREVCERCASIPDRSVVFLEVYHKNEKERLGR